MDSSNRWGFMAGFLAMIFITMLYVSDPQLLVLGYERLTLLIFFGAIIYGVVQARKTSLSPNKIEDLLEQDSDKISQEEQDFAPFGELLRLGFRIYVIAYFIKFFFVYFLFNYYDPSLIEMIKEANIQLFIDNKDTSVTEAIFQENLERFKAGNFAPKLTDFLGIALELMLGFLMAFVTAIFFKRERPDY